MKVYKYTIVKCLHVLITHPRWRVCLPPSLALQTRGASFNELLFFPRTLQGVTSSSPLPPSTLSSSSLLYLIYLFLDFLIIFSFSLKCPEVVSFIILCVCVCLFYIGVDARTEEIIQDLMSALPYYHVWIRPCGKSIKKRLCESGGSSALLVWLDDIQIVWRFPEAATEKWNLSHSTRPGY